MPDMKTIQIPGQMMNLNPSELTPRLAQVYQRRQTRAWFLRLIDALRGRRREMESLSEAVSECQVTSRHYAGLREIEVDQIHGSEARSDDFDRDFNPLNGRTLSRWLSVARARWNGVPLPPVELIEVNGEYFVRDGHHRISVARARGEGFIDAEVTVWEVADQMRNRMPVVTSFK